MKDLDKSTLNAISAFTRDAVLASSMDEVLDLLEIALNSFPVSGFGYWSFPRNCVDTASGTVDLSNARYVRVFRGPIYLKAAEKFYFGKRLFDSDPTVFASSQATVATSTRAVLQSQPRSRPSAAINAFMRKFGIGRDLYLPIHAPSRIQMLWVFSLLGAQEELDAEAGALQQLADRFAIVVSDFVNLEETAPDDTVLTTREAQCIMLIARGYSNTAIAADLKISVHSVKFHVTNMMQKLDAANRSEAIAKAARSGLLTN